MSLPASGTMACDQVGVAIAMSRIDWAFILLEGEDMKAKRIAAARRPADPSEADRYVRVDRGAALCGNCRIG
jgi:hypothetical protein